MAPSYVGRAPCPPRPLGSGPRNAALARSYLGGQPLTPYGAQPRSSTGTPSSNGARIWTDLHRKQMFASQDEYLFSTTKCKVAVHSVYQGEAGSHPFGREEYAGSCIRTSENSILPRIL
jgi:hypothetical protein